jgi:Ran GTPase-activating protein (RanGAP) involved in mRNA processing and transport
MAHHRRDYTLSDGENSEYEYDDEYMYSEPSDTFETTTLPYYVEQILREIFGRYLLVCGTEREIGHDSENSIERFADNDFLCSDKFYFDKADVATKATASSYLTNMFQRVDRFAGHEVESITMFYFLHVYTEMWHGQREVVLDHLRLHGWSFSIDGGRRSKIKRLTLEFRDRGIGRRGANHFAVHFRDHLPLVELNLSGNNLGEHTDLSVFFMSMSRMPNLEAVDLSNNKITMTKKKNARSKNTTLVSSLIMGLKTRKRSLKRLNFSSNRISGAVAEAILASNNGVEEFNLSENNLGDPDGVALARGVAAAEHLKALRLRENKIGPIGIGAIAAAVNEARVKNRMETLDLSVNPIGCQGAEAIAALIAGNESLVILSLRDCSLGYRLPTAADKVSKTADASGMLKLVGCLGYNRTLTSIDLSYNPCPTAADGEVVCSQIGRLATLGTLTSIDLSRMNLQDGAMKKFTGHLVDATRFTAMKSLAEQLERDFKETTATKEEEVEHYHARAFGPEGSERLLARLGKKYEEDCAFIAKNRGLVKRGEDQKRILPENASKELDRLRKMEDKIFVAFKKESGLIKEKARSEDLRHDMRMRHFEERQQGLEDTHDRELLVLEKIRARVALTYLNLEGNAFKRRGVGHLAKLMRHNTSITYLKAGGNDWGRGKAFAELGEAIGSAHHPGVLTKLSSTLNSSGINMHLVATSLVHLDLSSCRLVCSDGVLIGNILKRSTHHRHLKTLDLSSNFLWHTTSDRSRGDSAGFVQIFEFVKHAEHLVRLDLSNNLVESPKDADSICKAISRALGVVMYKGKAYSIPNCPLEFLSLQNCNVPANKDAYDILLRNLERTWALRFFHGALAKSYEGVSAKKFLTKDTAMPLTIVGRTDGDIALQVLSGYPDIPLSSWKKVSKTFYEVVCDWTGKPCTVDLGDGEEYIERSASKHFHSVKRTKSRAHKDGRYPEDIQYKKYGKVDVPEAKEKEHVRECNNAAFDALSKGLDWTMLNWEDDEAEWLDGATYDELNREADRMEKIEEGDQATAKKKKTTRISPIKRRQMKGRRAHRLSRSHGSSL